MKLERSYNTKKNVFWGIITKFIMIVIPFVVQTIFIRVLGAEYNGLKGMFSSILQMLNLAELGFGSALVFSMYKPIAEDDTETICALHNLYRKIYNIIGSFILVAGMALLPLLRYLIKGDPPDGINIYIVYVLYLINSSISYLAFAYKSSLLNAYQRLDIINIISTVSAIISNVLQIITLLAFRNFYIYVWILIFSTVLNNILVAIFVGRKYPNIKPRGNVAREMICNIRKKIFGLGISRICGVTRNAFDNIFISMFLGLSIAGIYNNYYYIFSNVLALSGIVLSAMLAGIGNSIADENVDKNYNDFVIIDYLYMLLSGWCMICMLCLYQPFMNIWVGKTLMFPDHIPILLCVYFYVLCMGSIRALYSDGAGLWWENRYRVFAEAISNIILNYFLGKYFGVAGIIAATTVSIFLFGFCASAVIIFKHYFRMGLKEYFKSHALYAFITAVIAFAMMFLCEAIVDIDNVYTELGVRVIVCCIIVPICYYVIYYKTSIYKRAIPWLLERVRPLGR